MKRYAAIDPATNLLAPLTKAIQRRATAKTQAGQDPSWGIEIPAILQHGPRHLLGLDPGRDRGREWDCSQRRWAPHESVRGPPLAMECWVS
jgi:hypothetical protein